MKLVHKLGSDYVQIGVGVCDCSGRNGLHVRRPILADGIANAMANAQLVQDIFAIMNRGKVLASFDPRIAIQAIHAPEPRVPIWDLRNPTASMETTGYDGILWGPPVGKCTFWHLSKARDAVRVNTEAGIISDYNRGPDDGRRELIGQVSPCVGGD